MRPDARRDGLLFEEVGDELVIYDLQRHRAHQLNRTAALVWRHCDGQKTIAELTQIVQDGLDPAIQEALVRQALEQLGRARLLQEPLPRRAGAARLTRRQALRKLGKTAALALLVPAVTSIFAPAPLSAGVNSFTCNSNPCVNACADKCSSNADCPPGNPVCALLSCPNPNCPCMQRRCTKSPTRSRMGDID
jgi:hypothetical protein